jgi:hypothetical protein
VVRVPADAGDGPVTVTSREGTSAASTRAFDYLGLGEPRRIQVASSSPILHRPRAVFGFTAAGDVVLDSGLYGGLVWAGNSSFTSSACVSSAGAPWESAAYCTVEDLVTSITSIVRIDVETGIASAPKDLAFAPIQLIPIETLGVLVVLGNDVMAVHDLPGLAELISPRSIGEDPLLPVVQTYGAADAGDGRIVVAVNSAWLEDISLVTVDLVGPVTDARLDPVVPAPDVLVASAPSFPPSPGAILTTRPASDLVPLAVGSDGTGRFVAAALDDGNVAIASLGVSPPSFVFTVETWSPAAIEAIVAGGTSGIALATKPGDDLSVLFDLTTGTLFGSVGGNAPKVSSADGALAFVANDDDNDVAVVNLATGSRVARVNLDVMPGAAGYEGAAAFVPDPNGIDGDVLFPSTAFPGLLRYPTGTGETAAVSRTAAIAYVVAAPDTRSVWAVTGGSTPRVEGYLDGAWSAPVSVDLAGGASPQRVAARGRLLAVGHDLGLSLVDGDIPISPAEFTAIPGSGAITFHGLGFAPDGAVWAVVERIRTTFVDSVPLTAGEVQLLRWDVVAGLLVQSLAATFPGSPWDEVVTPAVSSTATVRAAAWLEDGLWVFRLDADMLPVATLLDDAMVPVRTVASNDRLLAIHAISPNGRLIVFREEGGTLGYVLRFFRADPQAGFPEIQTLVFDPRVEGFTFDATGERLYVLTQAPDRLVTVD